MSSTLLLVILMHVEVFAQDPQFNCPLIHTISGQCEEMRKVQVRMNACLHGDYVQCKPVPPAMCALKKLLADGWILFEGSYYYFPAKSSKCYPIGCRSKCQAMGYGADLLVVESAEEHDFIANFVASDLNLDYYTVYLNVYKSTPGVLPGTWVNVATGQDITYSNWAGGKPAAAGNKNATMAKNANYKWHDASGAYTANYICKI